LTETEREACPDFVALRADAIAGMEHVAAKQRAARQRLEAINAFPTRWTAWPERRRFPRPEL
jgi:hypothetical protein